jgi:transcriptional regulator with XRE-family HTH domain
MFKASVKTCTRCQGVGHEIDSTGTGLALRALRVSKHVTLSTVANRLRISKPYLSDLENGKRNWRGELIERFIKAL